VKKYADQQLTAMLKAPLLKPEQEIQLGRQVQRWQELLAHKGDGEPRAWAERCGIAPAELARACRRGQRARDRMIVCNMRLVVSVSRAFLHRCGDLEAMDLLQEGALALNVAALKFDPSRGYKFSTYAMAWIRRFMTRAIQDRGRAIRIPIHIYQRKAMMMRCAEEAQSRGERMTLEQAFDASGSSGRIDYIRAAEAVWSVGSIDAVAPGMDSGTTTIESIAAPEVELPVELGPEHQQLLGAVDALPSHVAAAIRLRFGIGGVKESSTADIARALGMSDRNVRYAIKSALPRLKAAVSPAKSR
jgi:RNA polymerase nonessential primary-like sigma factor